jgi:hypothetical protein
MFYQTAIAFLAYTQWTQGTSSVYLIAFVMSGVMASVGGWQLLFGTKKGRIARSKLFHHSRNDEMEDVC